MYSGDWDSLSKSTSPLAAGLVDEQRRKNKEKEERLAAQGGEKAVSKSKTTSVSVQEKDKDERPGSDKLKSKEDRPYMDRLKTMKEKEKDDRPYLDRAKTMKVADARPHVIDRLKSTSFEPEARNLSLAADGEGQEDADERSQSPAKSERDSLLREVKRMIVERVDSMIEQRIQQETHSLRLQIDSLQRDVAWLRNQAGGQGPPSSSLATPTSDSRRELHQEAGSLSPHQASPGRVPTYDDLMHVNAALKAAKQGVEAQVADLWVQLAAMQEGLEATHLRHKLRFVATSMLAIGASDLSQEEKDISKRALQEEEAALKERLSTLGVRVGSKHSAPTGHQPSMRSSALAASSPSSLSPTGPLRGEAGSYTSYTSERQGLGSPLNSP